MSSDTHLVNSGVQDLGLRQRRRRRGKGHHGDRELGITIVGVHIKKLVVKLARIGAATWTVEDHVLNDGQDTAVRVWLGRIIHSVVLKVGEGKHKIAVARLTFRA